MIDIITMIIAPICSAHIQLSNLQGRNGAAGLVDGRVVIAIDYQLPREEWEYTALHEGAGHCTHLKHPEFITKEFGKPPFITEYARTDKHEDWAEEAVGLYLNGATTRKSRIIRRFLNR